jgi:hypothetical protein
MVQHAEKNHSKHQKNGYYMKIPCAKVVDNTEKTNLNTKHHPCTIEVIGWGEVNLLRILADFFGCAFYMVFRAQVWVRILCRKCKTCNDKEMCL